MKRKTIHLPEIKLVGLSTRTCNKDEMQSKTPKIAPLVQRYFQQGIAQQIPHVKNSKETFSVYTDYESDAQGDYTYFIGQEVTEFPSDLSEEWVCLTIPAATYQKFTTNPGKMPGVVIEGWQSIWNMSDEALGGMRAYQADFEIYDQRAQNLEQAVVDIYIGIR